MNETALQLTEVREECVEHGTLTTVDRRAAPRTPVNAEVGLFSETNFYTGFTEDISTGGIFIATYDTKKIGTVLEVSFKLPGGDREITTWGRVMWIREFNELLPNVTPGMGVQFEQLSKEDHQAIQDFVGTRPTMFFDA